MMRIGIDCRAIRNFTDGIGKYSLRLIEGLAAMDRDDQYVLFFRRDYRGQRDWGPNFTVVDIGYGHLSLQSVFWLGREVNRHQLDLFHSPFFILPLGLKCRTMITVPDLMAVGMKGFFSGRPWPLEHLARAYHRMFVPPSIKRADAIIAISQATADDIQRTIDISGKPIHVIPLGADTGFSRRSREQVDDVRRCHSLHDEYFLYVGNNKPYKNLPSLLKAFALYRSNGGTATLAIVSYRDRFRPMMDGLIDDLGIGRAVSIIDNASDDDLPAILSGALAFYFPSTHEGFGLPPLEAMACGCPTAVADIPVLHEVVGDAGFYFDPHNPTDITRTMVTLWRDHDLQEMLRHKGQQRARQFTWERFCRQTLDLYHQMHLRSP